ncbi:hypothetical protein ACFSKM_04860 [Ancylobacter dichloromethanicus]
MSAIERRVIAAHDEVAGAGGAAVDKLSDLKAAVTTALSAIALLKPLIGAASVMDLDFDAAELAIEKEEGGEARKNAGCADHLGHVAIGARSHGGGTG